MRLPKQIRDRISKRTGMALRQIFGREQLGREEQSDGPGAHERELSESREAWCRNEYMCREGEQDSHCHNPNAACGLNRLFQCVLHVLNLPESPIGWNRS